MVRIAIDPDLHKSGVCLSENNKYKEITSLYLWDLFDFLIKEKPDIVYLEFSKSNHTWHKGGRGASINVGKNKAVAIIIKEFLEENKIKYKLLKPAGYSNFFENISFFKKNTGWEKQTNKDSRSATAMLFINK